MILAILRRVWRITVLVVAALCFLLALFLDYDGLGQALGLGALLRGATGRIVLAGIAALGVAVAIARFGPKEEAPAATRKPGATRRKQPAAKAKPAAKPIRRNAKPDRPAAARPRARSPSRRR
jgi:mannose/fructose/N-acetylgalactosamine-specific phosphotransferase system component IIC